MMMMMMMMMSIVKYGPGGRKSWDGHFGGFAIFLPSKAPKVINFLMYGFEAIPIDGMMVFVL